ncbi:MAG: hypothetical protein M3N08_04420 [Pseudomonadota bacterium]|nr:hypothetical protein [Pseudomonadota bacterium]
MKKLGAITLAVAILCSCASLEPAPEKFVGPPGITRLNVATIDVVDHSGFQPANSPYKSSALSPTIAEAARQWLAGSLKAVGPTGEAMVVIEDASVTEHALPTSDDMMDVWFKRQQSSVYNARLEAQVEIRGGRGYAFASAEAKRSVTLPEKPTASEKQNAYIQLLDGLMKDFARNLDASIREHLRDSLNNADTPPDVNPG